MTEFIELTHPGEQLRDIMEELNLSAYRLAQLISVPQSRVDQIIKGKRSITPDTSIRLGKLFGQNPSFWLDIQSSFDLRKHQRELGDLPEIRPLESA